VDPTTVEHAVFQQNLFNSVVAVSAFVASLAAIYRSFRRTPPLAEQMLERFATKQDLKELKADVDKCASKDDLKELKTDLKSIRDNIDNRLASGDKVFKDLIGITGKLEGLLERCPFLCGAKASFPRKGGQE